MTHIYFSHQFGGNSENITKVENKITEVIKMYGTNFLPVSPIHATGFLYHEVSYKEGIEYCLDLLSDCKAMIVFGELSNSRGCIIEKDYCNTHSIPIIEFEQLVNKYNEGFRNIEDVISGDKLGKEKGNN